MSKKVKRTLRGVEIDPSCFFNEKTLADNLIVDLRSDDDDEGDTSEFDASLKSATKAKIIEMAYTSGKCDEFAVMLHRMTGWPIVSLATARERIHQLIQTADGRLLDASGYVTIEQLRNRYSSPKAKITPPAGEEITYFEEDPADHDDDPDQRRYGTLHLAAAALTALPHTPFPELAAEWGWKRTKRKRSS